MKFLKKIQAHYRVMAADKTAKNIKNIKDFLNLVG